METEKFFDQHVQIFSEMGLMAKLIVQLVVWNSARDLPTLFDSLQNQTFKDWELLILDNGSVDNTLKIVEAEKAFFPNMKFFREKQNLGFSGGHNILFQKSASEYVLLLNQDVILENDIFERLVNYLDENLQVASAAPRLMRIENNERTGIVDSLGLTIDRRRRFSDSKAGEPWNLQAESAFPGRPCFVFGVSASVAIYRREAVQRATNGRLFDPYYFSYQEDFDLAWQLQLRGYDSAVLLDKVAYHRRSTPDANRSILSTALNKQKQSSITRYYSYRNHLATLIKNDRWQNFILDFPWIFWYEGMKFVYLLLFDRAVLKGLKDLWNERVWLRSERNRIQNGTNVNWKKLGQWMYM